MLDDFTGEVFTGEGTRRLSVGLYKSRSILVLIPVEVFFESHFAVSVDIHLLEDTLGFVLGHHASQTSSCTDELRQLDGAVAIVIEGFEDVYGALRHRVLFYQGIVVCVQ